MLEFREEGIEREKSVHTWAQHAQARVTIPATPASSAAAKPIASDGPAAAAPLPLPLEPPPLLPPPDFCVDDAGLELDVADASVGTAVPVALATHVDAGPLGKAWAAPVFTVALPAKSHACAFRFWLW
jgi:hypothetical protein